MSQYYGNQYNPYGNYGGYQSTVAPSYPTVQPTTNKIYVTSLEDALQRYASPNSTMIYILQDESVLFEVYTDPQGKKMPRVKKLVDFTPESGGGGYVSRTEFDELKNKLEAFIAKGAVSNE
jgi:hypothetical protein